MTPGRRRLARWLHSLARSIDVPYVAWRYGPNAVICNDPDQMARRLATQAKDA
ncbi:MAG TPA: hypothetical protein VMZ73_09015 [Acidimicrobiales bacterium]|nr:hypothetical protein [Acidimicrobiales bacterium]